TAVPAVVAKELDLFGIVGPVNSVLEPNHTARNENSLVPAVLLAGRAHCQRQCIVSASKFDHNHTSQGERRGGPRNEPPRAYAAVSTPVMTPWHLDSGNRRPTSV